MSYSLWVRFNQDFSWLQCCSNRPRQISCPSLGACTRLMWLLMAAEHAQGLWPCSAPTQPNPADLQTKDSGRDPQDLTCPLYTVLVWYSTGILRWAKLSVRECQRLEDTSSSRAPNFFELKVTWEVFSLNASLDLSHGKESCSASLAIDLTASNRKWISLSLPYTKQIFLIFGQDLFDLK